MISYQYQADFKLSSPKKYTDWLLKIADCEEKTIGDIAYVFTSDAYVLELNMKYLAHDYYTDILTFDYSDGVEYSGDIFISVDRVRENAAFFHQEVEVEFLRVMVHGLLHLFGYNDMDEAQRSAMRAKENEMIELFHVEH